MSSANRENRTGRPTWLRHLISAYKRDIARALALGFAASACAALLMFTSGYLISATALAGTTLFSIMVPVACVQLFGLGRPLARYLERLASHNWVLRITSDLRLALFRSIAARVNDPARSRATGEHLSALADDVAHLQNLYLRVVFPSAIAYLLALGAAALFGFFSVPFALVILLSFAAVSIVLPFATLLATRTSTERAKSLKAEEYAQLTDDASGAVDWMLAGRSDEALARHREADARIRALEASARTCQRAATLASTLLLGAVLVATVVWAGDSFGSSPATANWIAAFALGFFPLIESFAALPAAFSESTTHRESIQTLSGLLSDSPSHQTAKQKPDGHPNAASAIRLDRVSYTYPGAQKPALSGIDLTLAPATKTAVLGRSGAGKSTLANLICGAFPPDSGTISLLGRNIGPNDDLSHLVGYLGQEPYLFNRTLRDNLTMGVNEAPDEQLVAALESVGLAQKLATLPRGLDTVVGETGVSFSGGEEHRVALARILMADTPIVVLDEPFSAIDPETERDLLDVLFTAFAGKTLVVITHHLAEIARFDRVIFIENGHIDLDGSPAELTQSSARFRTLVELDR